MDALLVAPISREAIFLGKALANLTFVLGVQLVALPAVALFYNLPFGATIGPLAVVMVLAADRVPGERWDLPTWLRGVEIPVPRTAATTRACGPVAAAIGALVDGRRSALATATLLASRGVPRRVALDATIEGLMALQAQR